MDIKMKIVSFNNPKFYSNEMIISRNTLNANQLKFTYQKRLIADLDSKHKEWSKFVGS